ncbi:glucosaminidase domain-containing protein [Paenibacillus sp. GSMTC-2017]|uniref:glucosaminidase domain-containing protein n=1 Tax=Paenibacillus sp. GSMTC-2017 TaxID=2794350 RepID=UPI0018D5CB7E|nr:glucosaminidase domain-containing protein [Paenibacillus sp. GSMTC-2017]MBH5316726.1 glucosaminidase domain-containing protein [Paenibacillus sp. GSMTC-2017]
MAKLTRDQFFAAIAPAAILVGQEGSHLFPSVRLAQSLLESGGVIHAWNNLGGIKVGSGRTNAYWQGAAVIKGTWEYVDGRNVTIKAAFRAYKSIYHFYKDLDLLMNISRYERVRQATTPEQQAQMLYACGYATDPAYASKLISIINQYGLKKYDNLVTPPRKTRGFEAASIIPITYQGQVIGTGYLLNGTPWIPARKIGEFLGMKIGWTGSKVTVNGIELESMLSESTGYVKVRDLVNVRSGTFQWDERAQVVMID